MAQKKQNSDAEPSWFPELIAGQRNDLGWSQEELGDAAGLSQRKVQELEAGQSSSSKSINAINDALRKGIAADDGLRGHFRDIRRLSSAAIASQLITVAPAPAAGVPQSAESDPSAFTGAYLDREQAYSVIAGLLEDMLGGKMRRREVFLAPLHGLGEMGARVEKQKEPRRSAAIQRFDAAIRNCIRATGAVPLDFHPC